MQKRINEPTSQRVDEQTKTPFFLVHLYSFVETGGVFIAPRPSPDHYTPTPEFAMPTFFGVAPVLVDNQVVIVIALLYLSIYL